MTALLDAPYGPAHPLWLGDDSLPGTPAAAASVTAATAYSWDDRIPFGKILEVRS